MENSNGKTGNLPFGKTDLSREHSDSVGVELRLSALVRGLIELYTDVRWCDFVMRIEHSGQDGKTTAGMLQGCNINLV